MPKAEDDRIFKEALIGYGFQEIEQNPEGLYCHGCCSVHKRPTKLYQTGSAPNKQFCKPAIVHLWNPEQ